MKLLILCTKLPFPPRDGGSIATLNLATGLAKAGTEVNILTINTRKHYYPPEDIPGSIRSLITFHEVRMDTSIRPLKALYNLLFSRRPYNADRFYSREFLAKLGELLKDGGYDIVQLEGPYLGYCVPLVRKLSGARIIFRAHNVENEIWERRSLNSRNPLLKMYYGILARRIRILEQGLLDSTDLLVTISMRDRERIMAGRSLPESIVVPTGIDTSEYPLKEKEFIKEICYLGALDWAPNIEGILWFVDEVMPLLSGQGIKLHIAGRNPSAGLLKKLDHPNVVFHGEVEDAKDFMGRFSVMVVPLFSGSGIRIKILEGMALSRCIVSTPLGAEGIPAEDGKHLLVREDAGSFADGIAYLFDHPDIARRMADSAREMVTEKFDTFAVAKELWKTYKKLA